MGRRGQGQDRRSARPNSTISSSATRAGPTPGIPWSASGQTYKLSLVPSGIFRPEVQCVIAGGVVLNPASLLAEIDGLVGRGVEVERNLMLSDRAHVIFPWHFEEDRLLDEQCTSGEAIGTTLRGIGPCYRDKVGRSLAVRLGDMYRPDFRSRIERIAAGEERDLPRPRRTGGDRLDPQKIFDEYHGYAERLQPARGRHHGLSARRRRGRQAGAVRGRPGRAVGHRPRHLPLRHQQQQFGRGRVGRLGRARPIHHQGDRHRQGLYHAGRRRPVPHRAGQRDRRAHPPTAATSTARSRGGRGAAAGSTPWPPATPPGSAASTCWR